MKFKHIVNSTLPLALALSAFPLQSLAQPVLTSGHVDLGVAFEDDSFDLHIHDGESDTEYSADEAILQVGTAARTTVPGDARYSFLGVPGSDTYVLPQVESAELLFLGIGAEEIEGGIFRGDQITFTLRGVSGPGPFSLYSVDGFGSPSVFMNSADGVGPGESVILNAGSHSDFNWAFGAPGDYTLSFEASGTLVGGGEVFSGPVDYSFSVVPEPSTWALLGLGLAALFRFHRKR